jgi:Cytochrome P450
VQHRLSELMEGEYRSRDFGHLAFGHGIHHCVGASLARMEGRVALECLLAHFSHIELDYRVPLMYRDSNLIAPTGRHCYVHRVGTELRLCHRRSEFSEPLFRCLLTGGRDGPTGCAFPIATSVV